MCHLPTSIRLRHLAFVLRPVHMPARLKTHTHTRSCTPLDACAHRPLCILRAVADAMKSTTSAASDPPQSNHNAFVPTRSRPPPVEVGFQQTATSSKYSSDLPSRSKQLNDTPKSGSQLGSPFKRLSTVMPGRRSSVAPDLVGEGQGSLTSEFHAKFINDRQKIRAEAMQRTGWVIGQRRHPALLPTQLNLPVFTLTLLALLSHPARRRPTPLALHAEVGHRHGVLPHIYWLRHASRVSSLQTWLLPNCFLLCSVP